MENINLTGRPLRKSLKLQNIGGDGIKPKKVRVYTPNLNVVRRKQKPDVPQKSPLKEAGRTAIDKNQVKEATQTPNVFFEGSTNFRSFKRIRNHKPADPQTSIDKPKRRRILSSSDEDDAPDGNTQIEEELQNIEIKDDKDFSLEPIELACNMKKDFGNKPSVKYPRYGVLPNSGEPKVKLEEKGTVLPSPFMQEKLYSKDRPGLTVFKLPDYISSKNPGSAKTAKPLGLSLKDVDDGQLGKLTVRRSGRIQVQIGRIKYDVDDVDYLAETTQVSSFSDRNNEGNLFNLGYVQKWFNLVPAWDDLVVK